MFHASTHTARTNAAGKLKQYEKKTETIDVNSRACRQRKKFRIVVDVEAKIQAPIPCVYMCICVFLSRASVCEALQIPFLCGTVKLSICA